MTYCFRHRFELPNAGHLTIEERDLALHEGEAQRVWITSVADGVTIKDATKLALRGQGFATEEAARECAVYWRGVLERSFAAVRIGADFGDRAPQGGIGVAMKEELESKFDVQILRDRHGLIVYECDPDAVFMAMSGAGLVVVATERWRRALSAAMDEASLDDRQRLAYELFSASFFVRSSPDARLTMLMMALETLIEPEPRGEAAQAHVWSLISSTAEADLGDSEKQSLLGTLRWLLRESVGQAGRRLAETLVDRRYDGQDPSKFFTRCYEMRSALVHGRVPRPSRTEVGHVAAHLEQFVGDLLAGPSVVQATRRDAVP